MSTSMFGFLLLIAAGLVLARIFFRLKQLRDRDRDDSYDERIIKRLRAQGSDPFKPHGVDFFFALPTEAACQRLAQRLTGEGYEVTTKPIADSIEQPFSLHAYREMQLSAPEMKELSRRFYALASEHGGRYDGWAAGQVSLGSSQAG